MSVIPDKAFVKNLVEDSFKKIPEDDSGLDADYRIEVKHTNHQDLTSNVRMYKYIDVDNVPEYAHCDAWNGDVDRWERKDWNIRDRLLKTYAEKAFNADGAVNKVDYHIEVLEATNKPNSKIRMESYKLRLHKTIDVCVKAEDVDDIGSRWVWDNIIAKKSKYTD